MPYTSPLYASKSHECVRVRLLALTTVFTQLYFKPDPHLEQKCEVTYVLRTCTGVPGKCTYVVQVHCDRNFVKLLTERLDYTNVDSKYCVLYLGSCGKRSFWQLFYDFTIEYR
jgi:hypothetical protein